MSGVDLSLNRHFLCRSGYGTLYVVTESSEIGIGLTSLFRFDTGKHNVE